MYAAIREQCMDFCQRNERPPVFCAPSSRYAAPDAIRGHRRDLRIPGAQTLHLMTPVPGLLHHGAFLKLAEIRKSSSAWQNQVSERIVGENVTVIDHGGRCEYRE
jgi:hypothetical protein